MAARVESTGSVDTLPTCTNMQREVVNMQAMSRPPSENVFQVAFKIPEKWIETARGDRYQD
jgi:hypothetical protein